MRVADYQPRLIYPDIPEMDLSDYDQGLEQFIDRFQGAFQGEAAFYQFGAVRNPGISDIDLLIVVRDHDWARAIELARQVRNSSGLLQFLFVHDPLVICESLVQHLPALNSVDHCHLVHGVWDPLEKYPRVQANHWLKFTRHAVWASFIRIAALEMQGAVIGLRRVLQLLNNLLVSAAQGGEFISAWDATAMTTAQIRAEVLEASPVQQEDTARSAIQEILKFLDRVDSQLDIEYLVDGNPNAPNLRVVSAGDRHLVTPLSTTLAKLNLHGYQARVLRNAKIVPVPEYQVITAGLLARQLGDAFPKLKIFLPKDGDSKSSIDVAQYARACREAKSTSDRYDQDYLFVFPFSIKNSGQSLRKFLRYQAQQVALSSLLRKDKAH